MYLKLSGFKPLLTLGFLIFFGGHSAASLRCDGLLSDNTQFNFQGTTIHEVLGLDPKANFEEVKRAYRKAAHVLHSDRPGGGNEEGFKIVSVLFNEFKSSTTEQFELSPRERYEKDLKVLLQKIPAEYISSQFKLFESLTAKHGYVRGYLEFLESMRPTTSIFSFRRMKSDELEFFEFFEKHFYQNFEASHPLPEEFFHYLFLIKSFGPQERKLEILQSLLRNSKVSLTQITFSAAILVHRLIPKMNFQDLAQIIAKNPIAGTASNSQAKIIIDLISSVLLQMGPSLKISEKKSLIEEVISDGLRPLTTSKEGRQQIDNFKADWLRDERSLPLEIEKFFNGS